MKNLLLAFWLFVWPLSAQAWTYRVVLTGDSILEGVGASDSTCTTQARLQVLRPDILVQDYAAPGGIIWHGPIPSLSFGVQAKAVNWYTGFFPTTLHYMVVGFGINDWQGNAPLSEFVTDYSAFVDSVRAKIANHVACLSPLWSVSEGDENGLGLPVADYRQAIAELCETRNLPYWNGLNAVPNSTDYFVDGVHPNDAGHLALATFLAGQFEDLLPE